jgi:hypothetical protein
MGLQLQTYNVEFPFIRCLNVSFVSTTAHQLKRKHRMRVFEGKFLRELPDLRDGRAEGG